VALGAAGIGLDVIGSQTDLLAREEVAMIIHEFPRLEVKRRIRCFCHIAKVKPETTYEFPA
jgi:hypothetical protein